MSVGPAPAGSAPDQPAPSIVPPAASAAVAAQTDAATASAPATEAHPVAPPPDPGAAATGALWAPPAAKKRRGCGCGCGGCLGTGCLIVLVVLLLVGAVGGALAFRVPQQLRIWPSGEKLLAGTPDRAGAAAILDELDAGGADTTGMTLYVMPVDGEPGTLAYAVLDTSAGFRFPQATTSGRNPIPDMITRLATGKAATDANVADVAIEYRDPSGQMVGVLVAGRQSIADLAAGRIDEASFSRALHGTFNPGAALTVLSGGKAP